MHEDYYFTELVTAFVRGRLGIDVRTLEEAVEAGLKAGLRLHKFKQTTELPRVRKVIGILRGLGPASILDVGSGRGTFLWRCLTELPFLQVTSIDILPQRVSDIQAVRRGGIDNLDTALMDICRTGLEESSFDAVTMLEVLEHLESPLDAATEAIRIARKFVIVSVPSKEDDNPEHRRLFSRSNLEELLLEAGAASVRFDYVPNHAIAVAKVKK